MVSRGAEFALGADLRVSFAAGNFGGRCLFTLSPGERMSLIEKERLGRTVSAASVEGSLRVGSVSVILFASDVVANTALMLMGVPGRLTK
jgi:hypothetical protein